MGCNHSWYDNPTTLEVLCEMCGVEQFVGKTYWDYLEKEDN